MIFVIKPNTHLVQLVLSILVLVVGSSAVSAQWKPAGKLGAHVNALASNDSFLFAATTAHNNNTGVTVGSVFRSQNKGKSWGMTTLKTDIAINALATSGPNVFVGTEHGVFHSPDNGQTWKEVNNGLPAQAFDRTVWSLAVSGQNLVAGTNFGVFVSTNKGQTWKLTNLKDAVVVSVFANGATALAGTDSQGVWLSTDSGVTWKLIHHNLPDDIQFTVGLKGTSMLAAAHNEGIFLSNNSGASWTNAHDLGGLRVFAFAGGSVFAGGSFGGPVSSQNEGKTWALTNGGIPQGVGVWAMTGQGSDVYAGGDDGIIYRILNVSKSLFDKPRLQTSPPLASSNVMFFNIPGCKPVPGQPGKYKCTTRGGLATCNILAKQGKVKACSAVQ